MPFAPYLEMTTRMTLLRHCGWPSKMPSMVWRAARRKRLDTSWARLLYSQSPACPHGGLTPPSSSCMTPILLALTETRMRMPTTRSRSSFTGPSSSSPQTDRRPCCIACRHRCCANRGPTTNTTRHTQRLRTCWAASTSANTQATTRKPADKKPSTSSSSFVPLDRRNIPRFYSRTHKPLRLYTAHSHMQVNSGSLTRL